MFDKKSKAYGGELLKTRKGRSGPRPLATRGTIHLVLRSAKAKGDWSFKKHDGRIREIIGKFSRKYGVKVLSLANVGNHLHFQLKLSRHHLWNPFIRAVTAAITMAVTGANRWNPSRPGSEGRKERFWDYRPFTRVVQSWRGYLKLKDYILINQWEGAGHPRRLARWIVRLGTQAANSS